MVELLHRPPRSAGVRCTAPSRFLPNFQVTKERKAFQANASPEVKDVLAKARLGAEKKGAKPASQTEKPFTMKATRKRKLRTGGAGE